MNQDTNATLKRPLPVPTVEEMQKELSQAQSLDDFFGKDGIFARLFARTIETMLEGELTGQLGYERYAAEGRNSGNSRNGKRKRDLRTSAGDQTIQVPRDRNGEYQPLLLQKYGKNTNEIERKVLALYAKGVSTRDIEETLQELYGIEVSATTITAITDKVWPQVEAWQNRPLAPLYAIVYLDAFFVKLRRQHRIETVPVYNVLGVDLDGRRDVLGHWIGDGGEGAQFWLGVLTEMQSRGVQDILIASVDGLSGFKEAIQAIFPRARVQRCVVHLVRQSLRYVAWKDQKAFVADLKAVYQAPTSEAAATKLEALTAAWGDRYRMAIRPWETAWDDWTTMFEFPAEIRRLIYTTNAIEGYHRQLRKVTKTKGAFPTPEAARKLLFLVHQDIVKDWTRPLANWPLILNQLAIYFHDRLSL